MKAIKLYEHGSYDKLIYENINEPDLKDGQINKGRETSGLVPSDP